jgi:transposase InsO family protein
MLISLREAERRPDKGTGLVHHGDRGSQYLSIRYTERLAEAGIQPSVGSVGDSYDNALAEAINWLFKAEVIHRRGPCRSFEAVEYATLEWVDWFNNRRLLEPIGNVPPAEAEANFYSSGRSKFRGCMSPVSPHLGSLVEARIVIESWRRHYNTKRPHSSLGYRPPAPEARASGNLATPQEAQPKEPRPAARTSANAGTRGTRP